MCVYFGAFVYMRVCICMYVHLYVSVLDMYVYMNVCAFVSMCLGTYVYYVCVQHFVKYMSIMYVSVPAPVFLSAETPTQI